MQTVIAIDLGHSAVKLSSRKSDGSLLNLTVPSFVCPAFQLSDETAQSRADLETVTVDGKPYFFGETARIQGQMKNPVGSYDDWITSTEHTVLLLGSIKLAASQGVDVENPWLVLGLPTHLFLRQKDVLKNFVLGFLKTDKIQVMPQPVGAYQATMLDEQGIQVANRNIPGQTWGVVDIGYYTTDFLVVENGEFIEDAMGACSGMRKASERMVKLLTKRGISSDIQEAESSIQSRMIKNFGKSTDVGLEVDQALAKTIAEVIDSLGRLMSSYARKMDGLIVAGGGAHMIYPAIHEKYPTAVLAHNSRFAVAEGMRRFGTAVQRIQSMVSA